jgi:hypothetical protein
MKILAPLLAGVLLATLTLPTGAQSDRNKGSTYKSPQDVFVIALGARLRGELKSFVACLAEEAQLQFAGQLAADGLDKLKRLERSTTVDTRAARLKHYQLLFDALGKHGLTEKTTRDIQYNPGGEGVEKAVRALLALIKNPPAFIFDYLTAQDKIMGVRYPSTVKDKPRLTLVKIDGDRARGTFVSTVAGKEEEHPVEFVKIDGGWKIAALAQHAGGTPRPNFLRPTPWPRVVLSKEDLKEFLAGTEWAWGLSFRFKPDGYVENANWTMRGLVTRWEAIDHRTVVLVVERGRDQNRYAILTFSSDLTEFSGFDFESKGYIEPKKRKGEHAAPDGRAALPASPRETLLGVWKARIGPTVQAEWTFKPDGTVLSSQGQSRGRWTIDTKNKRVLITWTRTKWDTLSLPLNPRGSTGKTSQGPNWRVAAQKVPPGARLDTGLSPRKPPRPEAVLDREDLAAFLAGTEWDWDGLRFKADGYVAQPNWQAAGLVTRWEAVDRRTVVLVIEKGRNHNRYAVLTFFGDLGEFAGFDFHSKGRMEPKKRTGQ